MKAAFVTNFVGYTGGDLVNICMAQLLEEMGFQLELYLSRPHAFFEAVKCFDEQIGSRIKIYHIPNLLPSPYSEALTLSLIKKHKYSLLVLNDDLPKVVQKVRSERILLYVHFPHIARINYDKIAGDDIDGIRYIIGSEHIKTLRGKLKWMIHSKLFPRVFHHTFKDDRLILIANSQLTASALKIIDPEDNATVLYPPVQSRKIAQMSSHAYTERTGIVYAGRVIPEKGIDELIEAMAIVKKKGYNTVLNLVGPVSTTYKTWILRKASRKGILGQVKLHGYVSRKQLFEMYLASQVYVHPNAWEPFGISVVEAMAAGCVPVVKRGLGGPWCEILGRKERLGFGYDDAMELAEKIILALGQKDRGNIVERALQFDKSVFQRKLLDILVQKFSS